MLAKVRAKVQALALAKSKAKVLANMSVQRAGE